MVTVEPLGQMLSPDKLRALMQARSSIMKGRDLALESAGLVPWYVKYQWPLIIGGVVVLGAAVYYVTK